MVRGEGLRRWAWGLALAVVACNEPIVKLPQRKISASLEPTVPATVITIQTSLLPQKRLLKHSIVIANGRARSDDELDRWRLFDLDHDSITYVDDLAKTYYTVPFSGAPASAGQDRLKPVLQATGVKRVVNGVEATQFLIRLGGYQRELWIGTPASVPQQLFGMMNAADADLSKLRGFPLIDHAELPYGKSKLVVDQIVVKIEQKNVPLSLINVSGDYKEVTAPGASRPPSSSPQRGRNTRATG